jgi:uroporphyrinogen-III decarboxylase
MLDFQEETGIPKVIDPWAGSYMMESLTQQVYTEAKRIVEEVHQTNHTKTILCKQNFSIKKSFLYCSIYILFLSNEANSHHLY